MPEKTLLTAAGLRDDEIRKTPKRGRRIDPIVGIARALRWTLGQAVGIHDPTLFLDREREIDPARLTAALKIVDRALARNNLPAGAIADAASLVYSALPKQRRALARPTRTGAAPDRILGSRVYVRKAEVKTGGDAGYEERSSEGLPRSHEGRRAGPDGAISQPHPVLHHVQHSGENHSSTTECG